MLTYYAIANVASFTLPGPGRRWRRSLAVLGAAGCAVLALTLPPSTVLTGSVVLAVGLLGRVACGVRLTRVSRPPRAGR